MREHEGVSVEICPDGHGLWISQRDLMRAVRTDDLSTGQSNTYEEEEALLKVMNRDIETGDQVRDCPMCRKPLNSVQYAFTSGVVIDSCRIHGIWLDGGELEQLEEWAAQRFAPGSEEDAAFAARIAAREAEAADPDMHTVSHGLPVGDWVRSILSRKRR